MLKKVLSASVLVLLCFFLQNCSSQKDSSPVGNNGPSPDQSSLDFTKLVPNCYIGESQPVLQINDKISNSLWNDPHVIRVNDYFVMYASVGSYTNSDVKIYRLVSADLKNWNLSPITEILKGSASTWDSAGVETPSVVYFGNKFYMFYTGYTNQADIKTYKIGYATSTDGINWTKNVNPLVQPSNPYAGSANFDFHQYLTAEPGAVVHNNTLYVYFTAMGYHLSVANTLQTIGVVQTTDGTSWTGPSLSITPDQTLYPRSGNWLGYSTPQPIYMNNQMHMYLDVVNDVPSWAQHKLHHLVSANGLSGWVPDATAFLERSSFTWTSKEIRAPSPLLFDTMLFLWFAGNTTGAVTDPNFKMGIGLAKCNLKK